MIKFIKEQWLFLQELKTNPASIGAVFPSSRQLGKVMVKQIPCGTQGLIVELGAGTGSITNALQKRFPEEQLIIIERSKELYEYLTKTFPHTKILLGDAVNLPELIKPFNKNTSVIVSSLPLRSLDKDVVRKIQKASHESLINGGYFIQFTYDPRHNAAEILSDFKYIGYKNVWCNLPPARVDIYQKCQ